MNGVTHTLEAGEIARVTGPARVEVMKGRILLVGSEYVGGSAMVIHGLRSYSIKALEESELRVFLGAGGIFERVSPADEVIDDWVEVADCVWRDVARGDLVKVMVIGPPESGKTTLTAFITNYLRSKGVRCCLIEGDVGQEDLAVPTAVAMTVVDRPFIWQRELSFQEFRFVGCASPRGCESRVIAALADLISAASSKGCGAVLVNTDGWVDGRDALTYKLELIRWVKPTHLVVLDERMEGLMDTAFRGLLKVVGAKAPGKVRARSREERRQLRAEAYRKYFANASVRSVRTDGVGLIKIPLFNCGRIPVDVLLSIYPELTVLAPYILRACADDRDLTLLVRGSPNLSLVEGIRNDVYAKYAVKLTLVDRKELTGHLVGIVGEGFRDVGVGVVEDVRFDEGGDATIKLRTPYEGPIIALVGSNIRLDEGFRDARRTE
ncbi:MAG: Clp1/GlmU family protein [Zestosphaera sp.]